MHILILLIFLSIKIIYKMLCSKLPFVVCKFCKTFKICQNLIQYSQTKDALRYMTCTCKSIGLCCGLAQADGVVPVRKRKLPVDDERLTVLDCGVPSGAVLTRKQLRLDSEKQPQVCLLQYPTT